MLNNLLHLSVLSTAIWGGTVQAAAPVIGNLGGTPIAYSAGTSAIFLDDGGDATLQDDNRNFNGGNVTASIVENHVAAEDQLLIGATAKISISGNNINHSDGVKIATYTGGAGVNPLTITLDTYASVSRVRDLLSALQYFNSNNGPDTNPRTVQITVNDGSETSAAQAITVNITMGSVIDLDGDNSSGAGGGNFVNAFTKGEGMVAAADIDSTIVDGGTFKSLTVTLTNRPDGTSEVLNSTFGTATQTVNTESVTIGTYNNSNGELSISVNDGSTAADVMQALISSIRYNNTAANPDTTPRAITFVAFDNFDNAGAISTSSINVLTANYPPVVTLSADQGRGLAGLFVGEADIVVSASVSDPNLAQHHVYDWSATDNVLTDIDGDSNNDTFIFTPFAAGIYTLRVTVTDSGVGNLAGSAELTINVEDNILIGIDDPVFGGGGAGSAFLILLLFPACAWRFAVRMGQSTLRD